MRVRDWAGADHYRELGVAPTATREEITAAFRARARVLHPDTAPVDPAADAAFVRAATAYQVLTGPLREEYDRARRRGQVRGIGPAGGPPQAARPDSAPVPSSVGSVGRVWPLTRRGGRTALGCGVALILAGLAAGALVVTLQVRDARLRAEGVAATAVVVREAGVPRLEFTTASGARVRTDLPDAKSGGRSAGDAVEIRYDRSDPRRVVAARHAVGRDITLWIVAAKLLIVGAVLAIVGCRRLLRADVG
ncbi:MAG: DnaJ domain-containing protein [Actinomycetota bacterium]